MASGELDSVRHRRHTIAVGKVVGEVEHVSRAEDVEALDAVKDNDDDVALAHSPIVTRLPNGVNGAAMTIHAYLTPGKRRCALARNVTCWTSTPLVGSHTMG